MSTDKVEQDAGQKSDNELIAIFMGFIFCNDDTEQFPNGYYFFTEDDMSHTWLTVQEMQYEESWDWLIPVARKIKELTYKDLKNQELPTFQAAVARWKPIQNEIGNLHIEAAHYCIVKWIEWYNSQK